LEATVGVACRALFDVCGSSDANCCARHAVPRYNGELCSSKRDSVHIAHVVRGGRIKECL